MSLRIGEPASPTFQQPLALMSDCHRRVERFLGQLLQVTEETNGGPLNLLQREALDGALRYFRDAAPKHTADEEESLFPRLRALGTPEALEVLAKVEALEADHASARPAHEAVEVFGRLWLAANALRPEDMACLRFHLQLLAALYHKHIAIEDLEVFPTASRLLQPSAVEEIGREMARRRGQPYRHPGIL